MSPCLHEPHEFLCNFKHREREGEQDHPGKNRKRSPPTKISMKQCYERKNPLKICISIYIYIYIYIFKVVSSTVPIYEKTYSIKKYNGV